VFITFGFQLTGCSLCLIDLSASVVFRFAIAILKAPIGASGRIFAAARGSLFFSLIRILS
jgi:hypothetical protein